MQKNNNSQLEEAADIGKAAGQCKKEKKYNLAKTYFVESAQRMINLCKGNSFQLMNIKEFSQSHP